MEDLRTWFIHWLPLIQGFAAVFSILGALASWRFAAIAKQARTEMTKNIIKNDTMFFIQETIIKLNEFRTDAHKQDDKISFLNERKADLKNILEVLAAKIIALDPYLSKDIDKWFYIRKSAIEASQNTTYQRIDETIQWLSVLQANLELDVQTRQFQQKPKN